MKIYSICILLFGQCPFIIIIIIKSSHSLNQKKVLVCLQVYEWLVIIVVVWANYFEIPSRKYFCHVLRSENIPSQKKHQMLISIMQCETAMNIFMSKFVYVCVSKMIRFQFIIGCQPNNSLFLFFPQHYDRTSTVFYFIFFFRLLPRCPDSFIDRKCFFFIDVVTRNNETDRTKQ